MECKVWNYTFKHNAIKSNSNDISTIIIVVVVIVQYNIIINIIYNNHLATLTGVHPVVEA